MPLSGLPRVVAALLLGLAVGWWARGEAPRAEPSSPAPEHHAATRETRTAAVTPTPASHASAVALRRCESALAMSRAAASVCRPPEFAELPAEAHPTAVADRLEARIEDALEAGDVPADLAVAELDCSEPPCVAILRHSPTRIDGGYRELSAAGLLSGRDAAECTSETNVPFGGDLAYTVLYCLPAAEDDDPVLREQLLLSAQRRGARFTGPHVEAR